MKEDIKQRMVQQIEIALTKLNHVPYILSKKKKMAVWSDIRESLFLRCIHPRCSVVLSALKSYYRYPASEKFMHPCTPSEQLQFIKQYMVVSTGTLLVDLNALGNRFELMTLYDMVKIKHDLSYEEIIKSCRSQSGVKRQDKHFQKCTENPLRNLTKKIFLPSIQRKTSKEDKLREKSLGVLIKSVLYNAFGEDASTALVPMYLLWETYPASAMFLEEAVRLYIIGRCEQSNLKSVSQCSMEEGYQFSRFLAMQYGFDKQWPCMTSNSLLMSWEEFWQNSTRNNDIRVVPNTNVSVITLNCKDRDVYGDKGTSGHTVGSKSVQLSGDKDMYNTTDYLKDVKMKSEIDRQMLTYDKNADENDKHMQMIMNKGKPCQVKDENQTERIVGKEFLVENQHELKRSKSHILPAQALYKKDTQICSYSKETTQVRFPDVHMAKRTSHKENVPKESKTKESKSLQNVALIEKRVTRSKSHNSVQTCKDKESAKGSKNKAGKLEKHKETFQQKPNISNPDVNNSAVHELAINKINSEERNKNWLKTKMASDDDIENEQSMSAESKDSIMTSKLKGNIEVSITPRKTLTGDEGVTDINQFQMDVRIEDDKNKSSDKVNARTKLKISSAKFADRIPDLLRVKKKAWKAEIGSFVERKQFSPKKSKSRSEKLGVTTTGKESIKPKEHNTSIGKSLELNVSEAMNRDFFPYKAGKVKHIYNKETYIEKDTDDFPVVNGVKVQQSPVKTKTSSCKSASTLPGYLNMMPSKAKSASLVKTGKLRDEIVSNLKQQASNSICSIVGNSDAQMLKGIVASGKEIASPRKQETPFPGKDGTKASADSSCFQDERIILWRENLETTNDKTCRPTTSIYNQSYADPSCGNGPSIMTGIKVVLSRDRVKRSPSPRISNRATSAIVDKVDVPNFGSSSSKTPDIYDEFARKGKPRTHKADLHIIKDKNIVCEKKPIQDTHDKSFDTTKRLFQKTSQSSNTSTDLRKTDEIKSACKHNADIIDKINTTKLTLQHTNLTSTLRKILEANLPEANYLLQRSRLEVKNESNSNQYSTCSMCRHESGKTINSEIIMNNEKHRACSGLHTSSSFVEIHTDSLLSAGNSGVMYQEQIKSDFISNEETFSLKGDDRDDFSIGATKTHKTSHIDEMPLSLTSMNATDVSAEQRITLLDKINLFADGVLTPKLSESLEDIENIKSNIKINPIETSHFENALSFNSKKDLNCMSVSEQMQKRNYTPTEFKIHNTEYRNIKYDSKANHTTKGCSVYNSKNCVFELPHTQFLTTFNRAHNNTYLRKPSNLGQDIDNQTSETSNEILHSGENPDDITIDNSLSNVECNELIKHLFNFDGLVIDDFAFETEVKTDELKKESPTSECTLESLKDTHKHDNEPEKSINLKLLTSKPGSRKLLNNTKSFREVIEEKRATNRMELSKETLSKSAKPINKTKESHCIGKKHAVKTSKKKKTVIKPSSEIETVSALSGQINESEKKKRPKTCATRVKDGDISATDRTTVREKSHNIGYESGLTQSKINEKVPASDILPKPTYMKVFKTKKKVKNISRPKTVDSKSTNERKLRPREVKSARTSRRTSYNLEGTYQNDSLKMQDKHMNKTSQNTEQLSLDVSFEKDLDTALFNSQHVEVDGSKIVCETIPYANILETDIDSSYHNDTDILTEAFITQCRTMDLQDQNLEHSNSSSSYSKRNQSPTVPVAMCNEVNGFLEVLTNSSHNAISQLSNETTGAGQCSENTLLHYEMDNGVIDNLSDNCVHQDGCGDVKQFDLSELPQSVLEVVLSDNLMEMDGSLPIQFETENEMNVPGIELCNDTVDANPIYMDGIPVELQLQNTGDAIQADFQIQDNYNDGIDRTQHETTEHLSSNCQGTGHALNNHGHISEVTDNGITVMHPNGTKLILTENHPAFAVFSDMFEMQNKVIYGQESASEIREIHIYEEENRLMNKLEPKSVLASTEDIKNVNRPVTLDPHIRSHCQQPNISNESTNKQKIARNGSNTDKESIAEEVATNYVDPANSAQGRYCTKNRPFAHSENIFDALTAELNEMKQQKVTSSQIELFTETFADNLNSIKVVNDSSDFEDDLIQMIKENMGSYASSLKETIAFDENVSTIKQLGGKNPFDSTKTDTFSANSHCVANAFCNITTVNSSDAAANDQHSRVFNKHNQDKHLTSIKEINQTTKSVEYPDSIQLRTVDYLSNKFDLNNKCQEHDILLCSDSDSSKTYEYGVESHSDLSDTSDNTSEYDDSSDADYYPEDEEIKVKLKEIRPVEMNKTSVGISQRDEAGMKESYLKDNLQLKSSDYEQTEDVHKQGVKKRKHRNIKAAYINLLQIDETEWTNERNVTSCKSDCNYSIAKCSKDLTTKLLPEKDGDEPGNIEKTTSNDKTCKQKNNRDSKRVGTGYESSEDNNLDEDTLSANNLVKMQKLYFDILKKSGSDKSVNKEITDSTVDIENILRDGFTLKRDRDISRAETEAERLKEGTGSLNDLEKDDCNGVIIEDPSINCQYQIVEDEDGITLGGVVYYNEYVLPFVYINGYKYTPLKDAATLFQPHCCAWKCRIPKSVMTKNKRLIKTFSTWEQVYKLELIKSKKGPPVKTGDMLVKLDTLVSLLPTLLLDIIAQHTDSKLKYSQDCDMTSYMTLQNKLN